MVEKVAKILDYFNKEKIVRIILLLFDVVHLYLNLTYRTLRQMKAVWNNSLTLTLFTWLPSS